MQIFDIRYLIAISGVVSGQVFNSPGADVAVPNPDLLGVELRNAQTPVIIGRRESAMPLEITLELVDGRVATIKAEYPSGVAETNLLEGIIKVVGQPPKVATTNSFYGWRFESKMYGVMLFIREEERVLIMSTWADLAPQKRAGLPSRSETKSKRIRDSKKSSNKK